jgi:hypothetical protein
MSPEEQEEFMSDAGAIRSEGNAYYSTARLWTVA